MQEIEKELKELREKQDKGKETLEQSVTDTALDLQDQVSKRDQDQGRLFARLFIPGWLLRVPVGHSFPPPFCFSTQSQIFYLGSVVSKPTI